jgi:hypothetical protein
MLQTLIIAIGAGLAAALLFFIPVKGTSFAATAALFNALPLMIAGLAFSPSAALIGAASGVLALFAGLVLVADVDAGPAFVFCAFFAATSALPAWQLTRLAWLGRPPEAGETPASDGLVWYPIGRLVGWMTGMACAAAIAGLLIAVARVGSFEGFVDLATRRLGPLLERALGSGLRLPGDLTIEDIVRAFVIGSAPAMAAWGVLTMALNLWLAGRIALVSQSLRRPWLDVPEHFDLPRAVPPLLALAVVVSLIDGLPRAMGATVALALGVALALKGLAWIHQGTRATAGRGAILAGVYAALLLLFPLPAPVLAGIGLSAMLFPRRRTPRTPPGPPAANSNQSQSFNPNDPKE